MRANGDNDDDDVDGWGRICTLYIYTARMRSEGYGSCPVRPCMPADYYRIAGFFVGSKFHIFRSISAQNECLPHEYFTHAKN